MKITTDLEEERTSACISRKLERNLNTWYKTKETTSTDYTYSVIEINPTGKKGLLLGINPRMSDCSDYKKEVADFLNIKVTDPSIKHRSAYKDALEPTRRNAIADILDLTDKNLKELVTVDLFTKRTHNSSDLKKEIKNNPVNEIIGRSNKTVLEEAIDKSDVIIVAWGSDALGILKKVPDYRNWLYQQLKKKLDHVYWYGPTKNKSPRHVAYRKNSKLQNIKQKELEEALGV